MTVTGIDVVTEDGTATATVDDQGRPTEILMDAWAITAECNPDGTANVKLTEDGQVLFTEDNVSLETTDGFPDSTGGVDWIGRRGMEGYGECCSEWTEAAKDASRRSSSQSVAGCVDEQRERLALDLVGKLGHDPAVSELMQTPVYGCLKSDPNLNRQLRLYCQLDDFLGPLMETGLNTCQREGYPNTRCEAIVGLLTGLAFGYQMLLKSANQGIADIRWDDRDCQCDGPQDCPADWECRDKHGLPRCRSASGCLPGWRCDQSTGYCTRDLSERNLQGCWSLTFSAEGGSVSAILQIDASGALERVWRVQSGVTVETGRFTVPEPASWQPVRRQMNQSISATGDQITITQMVEEHGYDLDESGVCTVDTSYWIRGETTIRATVVRTPPARLEAGTFDLQTVTRYPDQPEFDDSSSFQGTVIGVLLSECPDPADADVLSQEEQGDPCRHLSPP